MANNKVLIVDDDEHIVELIKLYMDKEGFDTVTANNGKKAVELFKSEAPAIVILDVMMPEMDGWQVCREIRRVSNIPIIMLTAKGETFDKVLGLETSSYLTFVRLTLLFTLYVVLRMQTSLTLTVQSTLSAILKLSVLNLFSLILK